MLMFLLVPPSPLSDFRSRAHGLSAMEGHADVVFAGASFALLVKRGSWDHWSSVDSPISALFSVHIHPMNVRHMSVSVARLGPRRGSGATAGIVPKAKGQERWEMWIIDVLGILPTDPLCM
jgi:hypothetical protein